VRPAVGRFTWRPVRRPALDPVPPDHLAGTRIALIGDDDAVADTLLAHGAVLVDDSAAADGIVDLTPGFQRTVTALRNQYDRWVVESDARRIFYVAVTRLGGGFGYRDLTADSPPLAGLWTGLAKTLHHELPNLNTKVIDVDPSTNLPDVLVRELYRWGPFEVGYRSGERHVIAPRRQDVAAPRITLDRTDVVLVSGGGRGIGFALAKSLAGEFGCRVVVTGRHPLPGDDETWVELGDDDFKSYQGALLVRGSTNGSLAAVRAEATRMAQRREVATNLRAARREGRRIDYEVCDVTDAHQVSALLAKFGPELTGVVHNAGVDLATRLPKMSDEDVARTVSTKVDGFLNLFDAVRDRRLKFLCAVGSMSGRLGGMVGQIAYAAANDGLAKLALWADREVDFPVMTLCWPTWERLGLITNFDAALRYMAAIGVDEGLRRWRDELLAAGGGEVTFLGSLGDALNPVQVRGFPLHTEVPGFTGVYPRIFHLGTPLRYVPGAELVSEVDFDPTDWPVLTDFEVAGVPAVPVSLLLENALATAVWVHPGGDEPTVSAIADLTVWLDRLGTGRLRRSSTRSTVDGRPVVDVRFTADDTPVAQLRIAYDEVGSPFVPRTADGTPAPDLRWHGAVLPVARWGDDGTASIREPRPADLWAVPLTPPLALPLAALENVVRSAVACDVLRIARITRHGRPAEHSRIEVAGGWRVLDHADRRPVLTVTTRRNP
jgi:NAD(P)-dependent dehydrogenase (short-subunit alcohol dehydrogenase family)